MEINIYTIVEVLNAMSSRMPNSRYSFSVQDDSIVADWGDGKQILNNMDTHNWLRDGATLINRSRSND